MKRRQFLKGAAMAGGGFLAGQLFPERLLAATAAPGRSVVVLFMRGAWDGLNIAPPISGADRMAYEKIRPLLAIKTADILKLGTGYTFGLHPSLVNMKALFDAGQVAILPRAGSLNPSRSHFEQQDFIESGTTVKGAEFGASGYFGRVYQGAGLSAKHWAISMGPLQAMALRPGGTTLSNPLAIDNLATFGKLSSTRVVASKQVIDKLKLYQLHPDNASCAPSPGMSDTDYRLCAAGALGASMVTDLSSHSGDAGSSVGAQLLQAATLIKEEGTRFVTVDMNGWDTHFQQVDSVDTSKGRQANLLASLDRAIQDFVARAKSLGIWNTTTLVIMSEFGRTVVQNGTRGTDHGRGGLAFVLGGSVKGKLSSTLATHSAYKHRFGWNLKPAEVDEETSNALEVEPQTDLRHVMARVLSHTLSRNYDLVKTHFTGEVMPSSNALKLFG